MAAGSVDSLSVRASLSLCSAHLCHICVCMAEHSHDSVMMVDRWILLSPRTATMWKNVNLTPLFIQIQNQKKKHNSVSFSSGLAKPMGLVEGPGGLGQGGAPATLGEDSRDAEGKYEEYGYNAQLSDRISLDRSIPDYRPKKYVHLQFGFLASMTLLPLAGLYGFRQSNPLCSWLVLFLWKYTSRGRTLCQESVISIRGSVFSTTMLLLDYS